jgi:hypothetical protein
MVNEIAARAGVPERARLVLRERVEIGKAQNEQMLLAFETHE